MIVVVVGSPDIMPLNKTHPQAQIKMLIPLTNSHSLILFFKLLEFKSNLSAVYNRMKI